ncbi:MAG: type II secretion system GspH family protein [Heliobacteriaceae bacterium]|jgi:prepilin-type N-terminal cleavage/methylation domain-containing protein|nr:type II secretion system GspH family protein [Heliobacteriaceae bacterium]
MRKLDSCHCEALAEAIQKATVVKLDCFALRARNDVRGFTLAEVLITLGIIGVVAALTMPVLIQNYRKHNVETRLKKVYSVMNQAANMVISERGDYENWVKDCGGSGTPICTVDEALEWFNDTIGRNLNKVKTAISDDGLGFYVYFADGSILYMPRYIYDITFYLDSKALANPKEGIDTFIFRFNPILLPSAVPDNVKYHIGKGFEPYTYR